VSKKILIVEDHPDGRRVLTLSLHRIGYETLEAILEAQYPRVNLSIEAGWCLELTRRVVSYDLDLGLIVGVSPTFQGFPKVKFARLATTELVFVVSSVRLMKNFKEVNFDKRADDHNARQLAFTSGLSDCLEADPRAHATNKQ
jgi:hypothetical protein